MKVFISYSHIDENITQSIAKELQELEIEFFLDCNELQWGDPVVTKIKTGLGQCTHLIIVISPASLKSQWVLFETGYALGRGCHVLPFLTHTSLELPSYLKEFHCVSDLQRVTEHFKNQKLQSTDELLKDNLEGDARYSSALEIQRFSSTQELYRYVCKRMKEAKQKIDDLTWGPAERDATQAVEDEIKKYIETIKHVCSKGTIAYREVMSFSRHDRSDHLERAKNMLEAGLQGYELKYYKFPRKISPPLLMFMLIDSQEAIIASWNSSFTLLEKEMQLSIKHPDIGKIFQIYYDMIWDSGIFLRKGNISYTSEFEKLRKHLSRKS